MNKTIRARFSKGAIRPLEKLELHEGESLTITIVREPEVGRVLKALRSTAGAWKGTHDADELKKNIYSDRLVRTRGETKI